MSAWTHFIGSGTYTRLGFLEEAYKYGVTRRAPLSQVKALRFGDTVALLMWEDSKAWMIGEMRIESIVLQGQVAELVVDSLVKENRAWDTGQGPSHVDRKCGTYLLAGSYHVDATLEELCYRAEQAAEETGEDPWVMVGGMLTHAWQDPKLLLGIPFHRGFAQARGLAKVWTATQDRRGDRRVDRVDNYVRA